MVNPSWAADSGSRRPWPRWEMATSRLSTLDLALGVWLTQSASPFEEKTVHDIIANFGIEKVYLADLQKSSYSVSRCLDILKTIVEAYKTGCTLSARPSFNPEDIDYVFTSELNWYFYSVPSLRRSSSSTKDMLSFQYGAFKMLRFQ